MCGYFVRSLGVEMNKCVYSAFAKLADFYFLIHIAVNLIHLLTKCMYTDSNVLFFTFLIGCDLACIIFFFI